jgi:DNA-binding NarL/FixJ family response regulator
MPLAVMLFAHATDRAQQGAVWRQSTFTHCGVSCQVVSWARPDSAIESMLSPAECSVVRLVIEGFSHAEIASRRKTSTRTVANQLASVFRRLKVSGRLQLCRYLVELPAPEAQLSA